MKEFTSVNQLLEEVRTRSRRRKAYDWFRHRLLYTLKNAPRNNRNNIRWFIQRGLRGWSDCDAWGIDHYVTNVMIGMLSRMTEGGVMGYPTYIEGPNQEGKWEEILLQIKDGFQAARQILDIEYDSEISRDAALERFGKGMDLFKEHFFALWD
jgi:hypothetical protein